jgi:hypothetical protein
VQNNIKNKLGKMRTAVRAVENGRNRLGAFTVELRGEPFFGVRPVGLVLFMAAEVVIDT